MTGVQTCALPIFQSANTAQACFDVIKEHLSKTGSESVSKGKIIVATVKGDIHDIGKNIVKTLLDNYGYTVVDLGRDVDPQLIVDTAVEQNITMVGLSAVLTRDYAMKIGADFYCRDAKESVDAAKTVFKAPQNQD